MPFLPHAARHRRSRPGRQVASGSWRSVDDGVERNATAAGPAREHQGAAGARRRRMRRILCADDGSDGALAALDFAIDLCVDTGARLEVVVAWEPPHDGLCGRRVVRPELDDADVLDALAASAVRLARARGVEATPHVAVGETVHAICTTAEQLDVDLVVVGTRRRCRLTAALLGSVSRGVVVECRRPVTIVGVISAAEPVGSA
jgi:nucleotide-binding universal stress UspA family protein